MRRRVRLQSPSFALTDAKPARGESGDEFAVAHGHRARVDEGVPSFVGHVVVIAIEPAFGQPVGAGEAVEFVE